MHHRKSQLLQFRKFGAWQLKQVKLFSLDYLLFLCHFSISSILLKFSLLVFSIFALRGFSYSPGVCANFPFCSSIWTFKCFDLCGHLFIDGILIGNSMFTLLTLCMNLCVFFFTRSLMVFRKAMYLGMQTETVILCRL